MLRFFFFEQLIGPFKKQPGEFVADDFKVLEQYETRKLAAAVQEAVEDVFPNLTFVKTIERSVIFLSSVTLTQS